MESIKKVITLRQAAKLSGYNQDYLGSLIRSGDIKGAKIGRNWCTTEEEIKDFLFRQKIRHDELAIKDFFSSRRRLIRIIIIALALLALGVVVFYIMNQSAAVAPVTERKSLSDDSELLQ
jgi:hypothetical protein